MTYTDRFALVEDFIGHLDPVIGGVMDPFIQTRYLGFVVVSAVTVYELAIKDILYAFADKKHIVLGEFARAKFDQMNGRIKLSTLKTEHVKMFGSKYVKKFEKAINIKENQLLRAGGGSMKASYGNVISWRHAFVHQGNAPITTNYNEVKRAYLAGKEVIHCLDIAMRR